MRRHPGRDTLSAQLADFARGFDDTAVIMNLLCTLWVIASGAMIVIYIRYALANYPNSWRWELLLISSSFIWELSWVL